MTRSAATVVLDVGKTLAKLSLWDAGGTLLERTAHANSRVDAGAWQALDVVGIERWLEESLRSFARLADVGTIIPAGHGAAAAVVRDGRLFCPPMDYESPLPAALRRQYDALRDPFAATGSPALPDGLNLGAQLFWLRELHAGLFDVGTQILLWPQYWAWRLSGVAATEVTSLGCHTDLWQPALARPSRLADRCGWVACLPPLRRAGDWLGNITADWVARTGLRADTRICCGLHDSNAALLAARGCTEIADHEATVLSTGTWFVAMRTPAKGQLVEIAALPQTRDCLANVDASGHVVPSARFMGGREIETLLGGDTPPIDLPQDQEQITAAVPKAVKAGSTLLPGFAPGCGPYPNAHGQWVGRPADPTVRRAAVGLYAALVADKALDLIGARERIVVEGRFVAALAFARSLASLRKDTRVFLANTDIDVSYGALRLVNATLPPHAPLQEVVPLQVDLRDFARRWHHEAERLQAAA